MIFKSSKSPDTKERKQVYPLLPLRDIVIFPTPEEILSNFTSRLIKQIPEVAEIIMNEKNKFLKEF